MKTTSNRFVGIVQAKQKLQRTLSQRIRMASAVADVPKGHLAVYVGKDYKRFVIPISYLSHPLFKDLLDWAEQEFGFNHPMGGLTIPCTEDYFICLTSSLN
ncbi:auxin-induced protein 15A [Cicer arietinum]|uniref:Auxin-induced protein 15A n=1 Tax=Cicer arietinum TaxID=3827 RepID=A0A1S2YMC7_CICAR|nr:auxin-induced protein 15A [Cicer arietinum]